MSAAPRFRTFLTTCCSPPLHCRGASVSEGFHCTGGGFENKAVLGDPPGNSRRPYGWRTPGLCREAHLNLNPRLANVSLSSQLQNGGARKWCVRTAWGGVWHPVSQQPMQAVVSSGIWGSQTTASSLCVSVLSPGDLRPPSSLSYRGVKGVLEELFQTYLDPLQLTLFIRLCPLGTETSPSCSQREPRPRPSCVTGGP